MNKNIIWGSVAVIVIVLFAWLLSSGGNTPVPNENTNTSTGQNTNTDTTKPQVATNPKVVTPTITQTFTNVLPRLGNYQCDYEEVTQSTRSTNTIYLSEGKMRGEFRSRDAQGNVTASMMVYDGVNLYTWTEGKTTGTVTQPKSLSDFPPIIPKDIVGAKVLGSGLFSASWYCNPWPKDPSMLAKPSYLKV